MRYLYYSYLSCQLSRISRRKEVCRQKTFEQPVNKQYYHRLLAGPTRTTELLGILQFTEMTINNDFLLSNRKIQTFNTYQGGERLRRLNGDGSPLMHRRGPSASPGRRRGLLLQRSMSNWVPSEEETLNQNHRSLRRRIFLLITEPETSFLSAVFYFFLLTAIFGSNIIMVLQTMPSWQFTPDDCAVCGGYVTVKPCLFTGTVLN